MDMNRNFNPSPDNGDMQLQGRPCGACSCFADAGAEKGYIANDKPSRCLRIRTDGARDLPLVNEIGKTIHLWASFADTH